jgi:purine-binding chemotaxis protein CheW
MTNGQGISHWKTAAVEQSRENTDTIDFKMVTFALGGKDYGIDIMKIAEIAKFEKYTYVPNAPPYVSGVYNLRGDIISLIDLRTMFNLNAEKKENGKPEDGLILRFDERLLGVIVDKIDRVIGISSANIQPPHPIFGDINIKYISGVIEHEDRLYIILDVNRIFSRENEDKARVGRDLPGKEAELPSARDAAPQEREDISFSFIADSLKPLASFYVSPVNERWAIARFEEWKKQRSLEQKTPQISSTEEAKTYLSSFYSPYTATLWKEDYIKDMTAILPDLGKRNISIWNPGCGKGYESYSFAAICANRYQEARIKIWANDNDLLNISTAPNLIFPQSSVPAYYQDMITEGKNGYTFSSDLKDIILFEYHDILHTNTIPDVDVILVRDTISFLTEENQKKILNEMYEKLNSGGILILGLNEEAIDSTRWELIEQGHARAYKKS